jgi:hypothetical protein
MDSPISDEGGVMPLVVNMSRARALLDCGNDRLYDLIHAGELDSYTEGHRRKVTMASIKRLIAKCLAANGDTFQPAANSPPRPKTGPRSRHLGRKRRGR